MTTNNLPIKMTTQEWAEREQWFKDGYQMFDIYEKVISDFFAGDGLEIIIIQNQIILSHLRVWDNESVIDTRWEGVLKGQRLSRKGKQCRS